MGEAITMVAPGKAQGKKMKLGKSWWEQRLVHANHAYLRTLWVSIRLRTPTSMYAGTSSLRALSSPHAEHEQQGAARMGKPRAPARWLDASVHDIVPQVMATKMHVVADGHTASNSPDLLRPPKLSGAGPG